MSSYSTITGLWWIPTTTIDPGLPVTIIEGIIAGLFIIFTLTSICFHSKQFSDTKTLHVGLVLLSIWLFLHWIDIVVHHRRPNLFYNYILFDTFNQCFRVTSDILIPFGMCKVMIRYYHLRPLSLGSPIRQLVLVVNALATIVWALRIYQLGLTFGTTFAWLSFTNLDMIKSIGEARICFEIISSALLFVIAGLIALTAWEIRDSDNGILGFGTFGLYFTYLDGKSLNNSLYPTECTAMAIASSGLLLRQFCEIVIVGHTHMNPAHLQTIHLGQDMTYGVFSIWISACLTFAVPRSSKNPDPLTAKDNVAVAKVKVEMEEIISNRSERGNKTAPLLDNVFKEVESRLARLQKEAPHSTSMKGMEIARLKHLYSDWEPIWKFHVAESSNGGVLEGEDTLSKLIAKNDQGMIRN